MSDATAAPSDPAVQTDASDPDISSIVQGLGDSAPASASGAAPVSGDPDISSIMAGIDGASPSSGSGPSSSPHPHHAPPSAPHPAHAPTRFQQAVAPTPAPELSWGDTASQAVQNFLPSLGGVGQSMLDAVAHPIKTAQTIGQVGSGLASQAAGALGVQQDSKTKAQTEMLAKALESHYAQTYGSVKGFKQALATDPASIAMDASTLLGGTGAAADAAGFAKTAGALSKVGSVVDPVQSAIRIASAPVSAFAKALPVIQSFTTGASAKALATAAKAGVESDPALRDAFLSQLKGTAPPTDIVDAAQSALGQLQSDRSANYVAGKAALTGGTLPPLSWQSVNDDLANAQAGVRHTDPNTGVSRVVNVGADQALGEIQNEVNFYQSQGVGAFGNLEGFDALKRRIGDIRNSYKNDPVAYQKATEMYNSVLDAIKTQHPDYADLMSQYGDASDQLSQMRGTFGLKNGANDESVLRRLLSTKTSANKQTLLAQLAEQNPSLPYMLAGYELHPLLPGGLRQALNFAASPFTAGVNPLLVPAQAALASPHAMASLNYGAGRVAGLAGKVASPAARAGAYYAGRGNQEAAPGASPAQAAPTALPAGSGKPPIPTTPADIDTATRMVATEAGGEPDIGKAAALYAFINRAAASGKSLSDEINAKNASESTTKGLGAKVDPNSEQYKYIRDNIVTPALQGQIGDPTGGMTHFLNPVLQQKLGRRMPAFSQGDGMAIGNHTFYAASGGRIGRKSGGRVLTHEQLVDRLMKLAKQAKLAETAATKPLLKVPDAAIVKALDAARAAQGAV